MISPQVNAYLWYGFFSALVAAYAVIMLSVKNRRRYLAYFIAGSVIGFLFDTYSTGQGFYQYASFYGLMVFGRVPFSMTLAEGLSTAITIYLFVWFGGRLGLLPGRKSSERNSGST